MARKLLYCPETLIVFVSLWLILTCDSAYWNVVTDNATTYSRADYIVTSIVTFGLTTTLLLLLAAGSITRYVLALLLVTASIVGYFTAHYGIFFDENMLVNVFETNTAEAAELLSPSLIATVLLGGVAPALFVLRYPLQKRPFPMALQQRALAFLVAFSVTAGGVYMNNKEIVSLVRNHREIRYLLTPLNILSAIYSYSSDRFAVPQQFQHIALDAVKVVPAVTERRPQVLVLVVGETARAANFSLGGYSRETNPRLAQRDVVYFNKTTSCGTATAESLPCMFAWQTREEFDRERSSFQDNLLDIAARVGYRVLWIDNGNTCKKVCARVESRDLHLANVADLCRSNECYDEILIDELKKVLADTRQDTLVVLHQIGSHGPAYHLRYPSQFTRFGPECTAADLGHCSQAEIRNAYDNSILYTDYVIDQAISTLETHAGDLDTALIYVSDHGESLGEHHLYLHGMPYRLAPDEQIHVPMLAWFSRRFEQRKKFTDSCTRRMADLPVSHDYLFATMLGLLDIRTTAYQPELDLFGACRPQPTTGRVIAQSLPWKSWSVTLLQ